MVIVQLNGGLGNQLFQYAAAKSLSLHHKVPLKIDISSFLREDLPELEVPRDFELYNFTGVCDDTCVLTKEENEEILHFLKRKSLAKLLPNHKRKIYSEPFYHFDANFFKSRKNVILKGQWQSEKYFYPYREYFKDALVLKPELIQNCRAKADELQACNSVSVHVRRGDYLRKQIIFEWHGVMGKDYYKKAFDLLEEKIGPFKPYYFTDDPNWVNEHLLPLKEGELVTGFYTKSHFEDFYLILKCKHNIIANSSFSWWGAWLNNNPKKIVIGPEKWFDQGPKDTFDILPPEWIKL
jgi:hypothetical protein